METIGLPTIDWWMVVITLLFILLDIASGLLGAFKDGNVSSTKMRDGLFHKMGFIVAMTLAYLCQWGMAHMDLGFTVPLMPAVCVYICITEIASVMENAVVINPELAGSRIFDLFDHNKKEGTNA